MSTLLLPPAQHFSQHDATHDWLPLHNQQQLLETIRRAIGKARATHHAVAASYARPIPACDPLPLFASRKTTEAFYWEQPSRQTANAAIGAAYHIIVDGPASMLVATEHWRCLLTDAVCVSEYDEGNEKHGANDNADGADSAPLSGPICFGGFSFDPHAPHTGLWEGFPSGMLSLPEALVSVAQGNAQLTLNALVSADDQPEDVATRLITNVARLASQSATAHADDENLLTNVQAAHSVKLTELCPREEWMRLVGEATEEIRQGAYQKVVLARGVQAERYAAEREDSFESEANLRATLQRLRQGNSTATVFAIRRGERTFLGATPERLAQVTTNGELRTMALAGTARRGATPDEDERLARGLLESTKTHEEHAIVVTSIVETLRPLCQRLDVADTPQVITLANVQHLLTPITGFVKAQVSALDVVSALHPTPAVGGFPRQAALEAIRAHEGLDRGWYAGPVGWLGPQGEGEFVVALRSALLASNRATLFAGCGIVADSEPQVEYVESQTKLRVMLQGLGVTD